jgi:uncharacterized membrane protein YecN with MAPEG domain
MMRRSDSALRGGHPVFVTPLYAGLLALWFVVLSARVVGIRRRLPFGDGGDLSVTRVIRAHANFAEYVPLALLMMGFLEVGRHSIYLLHALGIVLLVARLLHGFALSFAWQPRYARIAGAALTFVVLVVEAVLCVGQGIEGQVLWGQ